jgi:hypothetical protein
MARRNRCARNTVLSIVLAVLAIQRTIAYKEWCEVHHTEIMQLHYQHNPEAARRLLPGDDEDSKT